MEHMHIDTVAPLAIGPGCSRRDLPSVPSLRVWVVEIAAGHQWPYVDHHHTGEEYLVVSGELIEGEHRFGPGTYVHFEPGSEHQPRTETGVRLFGVEPRAKS